MGLAVSAAAIMLAGAISMGSTLGGVVGHETVQYIEDSYIMSVGYGIVSEKWDKPSDTAIVKRRYYIKLFYYSPIYNEQWDQVYEVNMISYRDYIKVGDLIQYHGVYSDLTKLGDIYDFETWDHTDTLPTNAEEFFAFTKGRTP